MLYKFKDPVYIAWFRANCPELYLEYITAIQLREHSPERPEATLWLPTETEWELYEDQALSSSSIPPDHLLRVVGRYNYGERDLVLQLFKLNPDYQAELKAQKEWDLLYGSNGTYELRYKELIRQLEARIKALDT